MAADDYCYLTTTGRRTGLPHRIEIWYAADGETLYLLAGGRDESDWVQNLMADATVVVEVDGRLRSAVARVLDTGDDADDGSDEERRARDLVFGKYAPRSASDLTDWRERALPVALDLAP